MMRSGSALRCLSALALLGAALAPIRPAHAGSTRVTIAFSTWTGYGGLVVAVKNGFFKKYGLDVSYTLIEAPALRREAFRSGRIDGAASTVDTFARWGGQGASPVQVFGIDRSVGGDGIVARKSITSVQGLKGKTIAVNVGSVSEWFLYYVLRKNGLSVTDVNLLNVPDSGVAGSTFKAGKVDVAVTWEPWLGRAEKTTFGHVLVSSKLYPNIIVDDFAFRSDFVKSHPDAVTGFIKGYFDAITFVKANPKAAYPVIGKYTSETPDQVAGDLSTVPLMTLADTKAYFGTAAKKGPILDITTQASSFWQSLHQLRSTPDPNAIIDPSFLDRL